MVKTLKVYECELCNERYDYESEALECENKGKEDKLLDVHQNAELRIEMSGGFKDWWIPVRVGEVEDKGHYFVYTFEQEYEEGLWEVAPYGTIYGNDELKRNVKF